MGQPYIDLHKENAKLHRRIAFLLDVHKKQATEIFELEQRLEKYEGKPEPEYPDCEHGTVSGYQYHKCRCPDCREVYNAYEANRRKLKKIVEEAIS